MNNPQTSGPPQVAVKAIGDDGWRVGGYLVLFGGATQRDLQGEWFTRQTDFKLDWYDRRPMLFEHSADPKIGAALVGTLDTVKEDDLGIWVEGVLDRRNRYAQKVRDLVSRGALGWSSGSMCHIVRKRSVAGGGEITQWPICEASITATPAEPRTLAVPMKHYREAEALLPAMKMMGLNVEPLLHSSEDKYEVKMANDTNVTLNDADLSEIVRRVQGGSQRQLPIPQAGANPAAGTAIKASVVGDLRYASLTSEDLSFLTSVYAGIAAASSNKTSHSPLEQTAREFFYKAANDPDRKLQREISAKAIREHARNQLPDSVIDGLPYKSLDAVWANDYDDSAVKAAIKANELDNTGQTGFGLEWVPTIWNTTLWRRVRIANPFAANMQMIDMPSNPFNLPVESTDPTVFFIAEATDSAQLVLGSGNTVTLSKIASSKQQITARKLGTRIGFSTELVEDSIIPILPFYRNQAQRALKNYVDDTIVNGDTASGTNVNVNLIDGTPTAGTSYLAMDGLRKYALVTNTAQALDNSGGSPTLAQFRNLRKLLNKHYAADLPNLVIVVSYEVYMKMLNLPEFSNWQQWDPGSNVTGLLPLGDASQVGDAARPVGVIDGIPVFVSAQIGLAQANGKISGTPANNTLGTAVLYHKTRWFLGYRRHIALDVVPTTMFSNHYQLWALVRFGLQSFDTTSAAVLYDIAV